MIKEIKQGIDITVASGLMPKDFDYCFFVSIKLHPKYETPDIAIISSSMFDSEEAAETAGKELMELFFTYTLKDFSLETFNARMEILLTKYRCKAKPLEKVQFGTIEKFTVH